MMRSLTLSCAVALLTLTTLAGCANDRAMGGADGPSVAVEVAPLQLAGVTDADYTLTVFNGPNGTGEVVWTKSSLTSDQYGDGAGSLTYVGPCDAQTVANSVRLELAALYEGNGVPITEDTYHDPTPLTLNVDCVQNADVSVVFDMTIVRAAQQGFFDVAVNFEDIFCSAKLDCVQDGTANDLELLHNPLNDNARDMTAVLGFACTGGADGTFLYLDDPVITCTGLPGEEITFDVSVLGRVDMAASTTLNPGGYLFGAAVYRGAGDLGGTAYWNVNFGLDDLVFDQVGTCTLKARGTASSELFAGAAGGGFDFPADKVYPVIEWNVPLSDGTQRLCTTHEVNGDVVTTEYVGNLTAPALPIDHAFDQAGGELVASQACTPVEDYFFLSGSGGPNFQYDPVKIVPFDGQFLVDMDLRIVSLATDPESFVPALGLPSFVSGSGGRQLIGDAYLHTAARNTSVHGGGALALTHDAGD